MADPKHPQSYHAFGGAVDICTPLSQGDVYFIIALNAYIDRKLREEKALRKAAAPKVTVTPDELAADLTTCKLLG